MLFPSTSLFKPYMHKNMLRILCWIVLGEQFDMVPIVVLHMCYYYIHVCFQCVVSHVVLGYIHCLPKLVILTLCAFPEHSSLSTHSHCFDLSTDYSFIYVWALT